MKKPLLALLLSVASFSALAAEIGIVRIATDPTNTKIYVNGERQPN